MTDRIDNPSRDAILARIRSALTKPAPPCEPISHDIALFPPVCDLLERLQKQLAASLVDCILTTNTASSGNALHTTISALPNGEIFVQDAPDLRNILGSGMTNADGLATGVDPSHPIRWSTQGPAAESSQATISLAEMLVASTGSIAVSSACGGRSASIIAPCHIVYAKTSQIVPDLDTAMDRIYKTGMIKHSFIGFVTGASRTGDIEKILVHGAHGPRKVTLVLQQD